MIRHTTDTLLVKNITVVLYVSIEYALLFIQRELETARPHLTLFTLVFLPRVRSGELAIYEAVASGDDRRAQILALLLTMISLLAVYFTNKISRSRIYG